MLKQLLLLMTLTLVFASAAMGQIRQPNEFEQSQSRIVEPTLDIFITPLVADIGIRANEQQQYYSDLLTFDNGVEQRFE